MYSGLETIAKTGEISLGLEEYHTHSLSLSPSLFLEYYQAEHRKEKYVEIRNITRLNIKLFLCPYWFVGNFQNDFMKLLCLTSSELITKKIGLKAKNKINTF